ncbi:hypothetical protein SAMN04489727_6822 [Amycolatopsis tolypomycina]|uniref:Uncharacterized protein n=1 Tax=Amycolatopsis tolypomycina TaxID=208445 RepID=A0A1H4YMQ9_9PSEU|nr:hypothetical protein SAMN04489727_6822 [Amycolatopsis tolypomycina]
MGRQGCVCSARRGELPGEVGELVEGVPPLPQHGRHLGGVRQPGSRGAVEPQRPQRPIGFRDGQRAGDQLVRSDQAEQEKGLLEIAARGPVALLRIGDEFGARGQGGRDRADGPEEPENGVASGGRCLDELGGPQGAFFPKARPGRDPRFDGFEEGAGRTPASANTPATSGVSTTRKCAARRSRSEPLSRRGVVSSGPACGTAGPPASAGAGRNRGDLQRRGRPDAAPAGPRAQPVRPDSGRRGSRPRRSLLPHPGPGRSSRRGGPTRPRPARGQAKPSNQ